MRTNFLLFLSLIFSSGTAFTQCQQTKAPADAPLHLVIDAGSSGTRFCLFSVKKSVTGCSAGDSDYGCRDLPAENGLADLAPETGRSVVEKGLSTIDTATRQRISGAALLGTGGFRKNTLAKQQEVLTAVGSVFQKERYPATLKVITGEDEGRLAWKTVAILFNSERHTIIEIGGATVQMATRGHIVPNAATVVSTPDGLTESLKRMGKDAVACENEKSPTTATACRKVIQQKVFSVSALPKFAEGVPADMSLYGLGAPWKAIFKKASRDEIHLDELSKLASAICSKTAADLEKEGMGDKAKRACYLFSYASELLAQTRFKSIHLGQESWPRGAAASSDYFPDCK